MGPIQRGRYGDLISIFIIGFLLCLAVEFKLQDNFERNVFENISNTIAGKRVPFNEDSLIVDALHVTHQLLSNRAAIFGKKSSLSTGLYLGSLTDDLMTAEGACGSYASVLASLLTTMGYDTRIAQMKVKGNYGGHIVTEVYTRKGWVVLDASYDLFFVTPVGRLASFDEVSADWDYYARQAPAGYNADYRYGGVRYANWGKIPILLPSVKIFLTLLLGEEKMRTFSIRPMFLRRYKTYFLLLIPLILLLAARLLVNRSILKRTKLMSLLSGISWSNVFLLTRSRSKRKKNYYLSFTNEVNLRLMLNCRNSSDWHTQKTSAEISVFNLPFNSALPKLKAKLGLPRYHFSHQHCESRHDIYYYKIYLYGKSAIAQFHYYDNRYFLCNITLVNVHGEEKEDILDTLAQKYAISTDNNDVIIALDREKNLLLFDNSVNLNISYVNNDLEIIRTLLEPSSKKTDANYRPFRFKLQEIL